MSIGLSKNLLIVVLQTGALREKSNASKEVEVSRFHDLCLGTTFQYFWGSGGA